MNQKISINEAKRMIKGSNLIVKDVSGSGSYGYKFAIFRGETITEPIVDTRAVGEPLVGSISIYEPETRNKAGGMGAFRTVFNRQDVERLVSSK